MSHLSKILDYSKKNLKQIPDDVLLLYNLQMLYLEGNEIEIIPDQLFLNLKLLKWLDLRNNLIKDIPISIGKHENLENLLLSNNQIKTLPNELGLTPKLKILQLSSNPLTYPEHSIITQGVQKIKEFLKDQLDKDIPPPAENPQLSKADDNEEKVLSIINPSYDRVKQKISSFFNIDIEDKSTESKIKILQNIERNQQSDKIVHKVSRGVSKMSIVSSCLTPRSRHTKFEEAEMKRKIGDKIRKILSDQEHILQQERNLRVLSSWRFDKKLSKSSTKIETPLTPPFATYPEYNTILSRKDLAEEIDKMIEKSKSGTEKIDIDFIIDDLTSQMKNLEKTFNDTLTPRSEAENAEKQINTLMQIHKKLLKLKENK